MCWNVPGGTEEKKIDQISHYRMMQNYTQFKVVKMAENQKI